MRLTCAASHALAAGPASCERDREFLPSTGQDDLALHDLTWLCQRMSAASIQQKDIPAMNAPSLGSQRD